MTINALHDWVAIRVADPETVTRGGILIPENQQEQYDCIGTVVGVGPGKTLDSGEVVPPSVKLGDLVHYDFKVWDRRVLESVGEIVFVHDYEIDAVLAAA